MRNAIRATITVAIVGLLGLGARAVISETNRVCAQPITEYEPREYISVKKQVMNDIPSQIATPTPTPTPTAEPTPTYLIEFVDSDIELMARTVMSEASILPIEAKQAVAQTIVNRVRSEKFPDTIAGVICQPNQYSTADNGEPTQDCYDAVYSALIYEGFPTDMYYFRTNHPHGFGYFYCKIGNTYFNTTTKYE